VTYDQLGEKIRSQEGDIRALYRLYRNAMKTGGGTYAAQLRKHIRDRIGNLRWMRDCRAKRTG
jgi:hypothetical protein